MNAFFYLALMAFSFAAVSAQLITQIRRSHHSELYVDMFLMSRVILFIMVLNVFWFELPKSTNILGFEFYLFNLLLLSVFTWSIYSLTFRCLRNISCQLDLRYLDIRDAGDRFYLWLMDYGFENAEKATHLSNYKEFQEYKDDVNKGGTLAIFVEVVSIALVIYLVRNTL